VHFVHTLSGGRSLARISVHQLVGVQGYGGAEWPHAAGVHVPERTSATVPQ
jgi:hypothetical protein